jgi:hypothetical protein
MWPLWLHCGERVMLHRGALFSIAEKPSLRSAQKLESIHSPLFNKR